jgi:hypothetical protein
VRIGSVDHVDDGQGDVSALEAPAELAHRL